MTKDTFLKMWKKFLIDIDKSETQLAKELNLVQSNFNRKTKTGTIKYIEIAEIVEKYGYTVDIRKKDN